MSRKYKFGDSSTMFRGYDPALGRFMQIDPLAHMSSGLTPYHYAGNNPIGYNDPTGLLTQAEFDQILSDLWNHPYGGSWSADVGDGGGGTTTYYTSNLDVFYGGVEAIDKSNGWGSTAYGSFEESAQAYAAATGEPIPLRPVNILETRMNDNWLQTRIDEALAGKFTPGKDYWQQFTTWTYDPTRLWGAYSPGQLTPGQWLTVGIAATGIGALEVGGGALLVAAGRYAASLTLRSAATNFSLSVASQAVVKQDLSKIDFLDAGLAGLGGQGWGQVAVGVLGGLVDYTGEKGFVSAGDKSGFQLGADIGTGAASGLIGVGINAPGLNLSPAWQNAGGFLNNMFGDGLNTTLTLGEH
ncbi:MAG: hypothetical protein JST69_09935 [Bacteroidetes bacterium]|nr:hypothetical protein [Bacteroidota bacterium]